LQSEDRESSRNLPRTFMECSYTAKLIPYYNTIIIG
jgi:hypothetical protein